MQTWHIYTIKSDGLGQNNVIARAVICRWENSDYNPDSHSPGRITHHVIESATLGQVKTLAKAMAPRAFWMGKEVR